MTTDLITSTDFEALLAVRDAIFSRLSEVNKLLQEAQDLSTSNDLGQLCGVHDYDMIKMRDFLRPGGHIEAVKYTDRRAWELLLQRSHVLDLMSAAKKAEWRDTIRKGNAPPFSAEAISGTLKDLYARREDMFEQSIVECFESLAQSWVAHKPTGFGERIVVSHFAALHSGKPDDDACDRVDDLIRFMSVFDGNPTPHARDVRARVLAVCLNKGERTFENDFLSLRWFKNGNAHVKFKRMDLVEAMNRVIAKHRGNALPRPKHR